MPLPSCGNGISVDNRKILALSLAPKPHAVKPLIMGLRAVRPPLFYYYSDAASW